MIPEGSYIGKKITPSVSGHKHRSQSPPIRKELQGGT
jgi:hypothetical protein